MSSEQLGLTYYLLILNIFIFDMVSSATDLLTAFVYDEGEGAKGMDNVESLISKILNLSGAIKEWEANKKQPAKSCTFVFDNCPEQNKNKVVIRAACL